MSTSTDIKRGDRTIFSVGAGPRATYFLRQAVLQERQARAQLQAKLQNPAQFRNTLITHASLEEDNADPAIKKDDAFRLGIKRIFNLRGGADLQHIKDEKLQLTPEEIETATGKLTLHFADPEMFGAGAVWSILKNPDHLYANTPARQLTACADSNVEGAVHDNGPNLGEWLERDFENVLDRHFEFWKQHRFAEGGADLDSIDPRMVEIYEWFEAQLSPVLEGYEEAEYADAVYSSWKDEKFDKWFNEKAYKDPALECYKRDRSIQLHEDYYPPRLIYGFYLHDMAMEACELAEELNGDLDVVYQKARVKKVEPRHTEEGQQRAVIKFEGEPAPANIEADDVTLCIGLTKTEPRESEKRLAIHATEHPQTTRYYPSSFKGSAITNLFESGYTDGSELNIALIGQGLHGIDVVHDAIAVYGPKDGNPFYREENGELAYRATGREPSIILTSLSATPHAGKPLNVRQEAYEPVFFTRDRIDDARKAQFQKLVRRYTREHLSEKQIEERSTQLRILTKDARGKKYDPRFEKAEIFPDIDPETGIMNLNDKEDGIFTDLFREMEYVYYSTVLGQEHGDEYKRIARDEGKRVSFLKSLPPEKRLNMGALIDPVNTLRPDSAIVFNSEQGKYIYRDSGEVVNGDTPRQFSSQEEFQDFILDLLRKDIDESKLGDAVGVGAVRDSLRELKDNIRYLTEFGGITVESAEKLPLFLRFMNKLSGGPPTFRNEEMMALAKAGVVKFAGPGTQVLAPEHFNQYIVQSQAVAAGDGTNRPFRQEVSVVINSFGGGTDIRRSQMTLIKKMLENGTLTPFSIEDRLKTTGQTHIELGGANIDGRYRLINAEGEIVNNIYAFGLLSDRGAITMGENAARPNLPHGSASITAGTLALNNILENRMKETLKIAAEIAASKEDEPEGPANASAPSGGGGGGGGRSRITAIRRAEEFDLDGSNDLGWDEDGFSNRRGGWHLDI